MSEKFELSRRQETGFYDRGNAVLSNIETPLDIEVVDNPEERQFLAQIGSKVLQEFDESAKTSDALEGDREDEAMTADHSEDDEAWIYPDWIMQAEATRQAETEQRIDQIHTKAKQNGLMRGIVQKLHTAISNLARQPKSAIAILIAASTLSSTAAQVDGGAMQPTENLTAIETEVGPKIYNWYPDADFSKTTIDERRRENSQKNKFTELDNGDSIPELMAAMDRANYEIHAEFTPDGKKLYERTYFKTAKSPGRQGELKGVVGTIDVHNHPTDSAFSVSDFKNYASLRPSKALVVTNKYVYMLEPGEEGWPKPKEAKKSFQETSERADKLITPAIRRDVPKSELAALFSQQHMELLAAELGMKFTILDRKDQNGDHNPMVDRFLSDLEGQSQGT